MSQDFYASKEYRDKQSLITKSKWQKGFFNFLRKKIDKVCVRKGCGKIFLVTYSDPKIYCSRSCAVATNNSRRTHPVLTKEKIGKALRGRKYPNRPRRPLRDMICKVCGKGFKGENWKERKYCSVNCSIRYIGSLRTSPKAARGKSGIRQDISPTIYFYSRWEANVARIFNLLGLVWEFQPKSFDLETQKYTPDFYLPGQNTWIEVKNFMSEYSKSRDEKFRRLYPDHKLLLILKEDYLKMQKTFSPKIKEWEYS